MKVAEGVEAEIEQLGVDDVAPGLCASALALARLLDEQSGATAAANAARELRAIMIDLRKLSPVGEEGDALDDLAQRREARRTQTG